MAKAKLIFHFLTDILSVVGRRYILYLCLVALTGLMEAVSLASLAPLLAASGITSSGSDAAAGSSGVAAGVLKWLGVQPSATSVGLLVLALLIVSTALFLAQAYAGATLQTRYVYLWQRRLASAIFGARWKYFLTHRNGDLINAVVTETQRLGGAFYQAGLLLTGIVHGLLFFAVAAALSLTTTAAVLACGVVLFLVTRPLIQRAYRLGSGISTENATLQSLAGELVSGAKLVKATATETEAVGLIAGSADRLRQFLLGNAFDVQVVKGVFDFGTAVMAAAILVASHTLLGTSPAVTLIILAIFIRLMPKLTAVQYSLQSLSLSLPAVELLHTIAVEAESEAEAASAERLPEQLAQGPFAVSLRKVHVQYGPVEALSGVDLEIAAGSCVALVGGSGAGKSSLVDAVLGLVQISAGEVLVNGIALEMLPLTSLRRRIGYMGQDTVLYNASIRENILWGKRTSAKQELEESARLAGADVFIRNLREGYETPVGDAGGLLSGGERQRLGLARAALGTPGLLILDEATSALDAETERTVTDAVASLKGKTTVMMIAHRLSSATIADTICVMEQGRVVETGSWDELMRRQGRFFTLWGLQHTRMQGTGVDV
jgi:ATP-binding cassette subfamily C protein